MKFRKKPIVIEAEQWFPGVKIDGVIGTQFDNPGTPESMRYHVRTLEGPLHVSPGDWIITGVNGEKYPCKPDIFEKTYDSADAKRRFTVVSIYDADDTECGGDAYVKLIDENGKVVDEGDYYHNKIDDRIESFFETLDYLGVAYEKSEVKRHEGDGERT